MTKACMSHECMTNLNATQVLSADIVAPWVRCKFKVDNFEITVGNETSKSKGDYIPMDNLSCIKSFQYGFTAGGQPGSFEVNLEIEDAQGGEFDRFITHVYSYNSDKLDLAKQFHLEFQFGWTYRNCFGDDQSVYLAHQKNVSTYISRTKYSIPVLVEVNYDVNKIKFNIKGSAPQDQMVNVNAVRTTYGSDNDPMKLKNAIIKICEDHGIIALFLRRVTSEHIDPKVTQKLKQQGLTEDEITIFKQGVIGIDLGSVEEWCFKDDCNGPLDTWRTNNRDPVEVTAEWVQGNRTDRDEEGIIQGVWNEIPGKPMMIFWAALGQKCDGSFGAQMKALGYYAVNAGKCSPVISFKTNIKAHAPVLNQGGDSSNESAEPIEATDLCDTTGEGTGAVLQTPPWVERRYGTKATEEYNKSHQSHSRAYLGSFQAVNAELLCQGDPRMDCPLSLHGRRIGLLVINPFFLGGGTDCPQFIHLTSQPVNDFLTHDAWMISGIDHQIREGSFTTCYQIYSTLPGKTIDRNALFGGPTCGVKLKKT